MTLVPQKSTIAPNTRVVLSEPPPNTRLTTKTADDKTRNIEDEKKNKILKTLRLENTPAEITTKNTLTQFCHKYHESRRIYFARLIPLITITIIGINFVRAL